MCTSLLEGRARSSRCQEPAASSALSSRFSSRTALTAAQVRKKTGKVQMLHDMVMPVEISPSVCIGHTRWATHGEPSDVCINAGSPCNICTGTRPNPAESALGLGSPVPHLHPDWARPYHICTQSGLTPNSARDRAHPCSICTRIGLTLPHLHRDWARPYHMCTQSGLTPHSAPGPGSPLQHLHEDWAHPCPHLHRDWARPNRILHRDWARPGTLHQPRLGSPLPQLRRDRAHPCHICTGTGLTPPTSAPGPGSPRPHLRRDRARPLSYRTAAPARARTSVP